MTNKATIAIICGGQSAEHRVSLISALSVVEAIDDDKYQVIIIGIAKNGDWGLYEPNNFVSHPNNPKAITLNKPSHHVALIPYGGQSRLIDINSGDILAHPDVAFPILHGTHGEDGTIQGLLRICHLPFVGSDVLGSAIAMDKDIAKQLLHADNIPVANWITLYKSQEADVPAIIETVGLPCFVKPANAGSSVGVSKVMSASDLSDAIEYAFRYDNKVIIEQAITGREIECAILGGDTPQASILGEIVPKHDFYSYQAKYLDDDGADLLVPAKVSELLQHKLQVLAKRTFTLLQLQGLARIDFFVTDDESIFLNEANTIPGFTSISMYPKLFAHTGVPYPQLIDKLISLAMKQQQQRKQLELC